MVDELRLTFDECRAELRRRLAERAPGRIQVVTGPRQVGKTTLHLDTAAGHGLTAMSWQQFLLKGPAIEDAR